MTDDSVMIDRTTFFVIYVFRILAIVLLPWVLCTNYVWAANECLAEGAGADTLNCAGGAYATGITYTNSDGLTLNLNDPTITVSTAAGTGVSVTSSAANTNNIVINATAIVSSAGGASGHGLQANNTGVAGDAIIAVASGDISGAGQGVYALISNAVNAGTTTITITGGAASTTGGSDIGVYSRNNGLGAANASMSGGSITTVGIFASGLFSHVGNAASTADATTIMTGGSVVVGGGGVDANAVYSRNDGLGAANVILSGGTVNAVGRGAWSRISNAVNTAAATTTMTGGTVTASNIAGIASFTSGLGHSNTTLSGGSITTTGTNTYGVYSQISNVANTVSSTIVLSGGSVSTSGTAAHGLYGRHTGTGITNISSASTVTASGSNADGIRAASTGGATYNIDVTAGTVKSGADFAAGIHVISAGGGTIDISAGATVDGSSSNIAFRDGDSDNDGVDENAGNVVITSAGNVTGDAILGLGNDVFNLIGGSNTGDIYGDDKVASANDGNDSFNWTGGDLNSGFFGGNGSDAATISSNANYEGSEILDGGDDYSAADGWVDTLTLRDQTVTAGAGTILNWENIIIDGGVVNFGSALEVGSESTLGLTTRNGGTVFSDTNFILTGNLINNGIVSIQDGVVGNTFTVNGDYSGTGHLAMDVVLGSDTSLSDSLIISGDSSGSTTLNVNNIGGNGGQATIGIQVVQVNGNSNAGFTLAGDYVTARGNQAVIGGAYAYTIVQKTDGHWYLQSVDGGGAVTPLYQPGVPVYELYTQGLLKLNGLSSMDERIGQRYISSQQPFSDNCFVSSVDSDDGVESLCGSADRASWAKLEGAQHHTKAKSSTTGAKSDSEQWTFEVGIDHLLHESSSGRFFMSPTVHYGVSEIDIASDFGNGSVDSKAYGVGITATWVAENDFYVDGQARYSWYNSDLYSNTLGSLKSGNDGNGYATSIELGQHFTVSDGLVVSPQAQLIYSEVNFNTFTGPNNEVVSASNSRSLKSRFGVAVDRKHTSIDKNKKVYRTHRYVVGNIYYEHLGENDIDVSGTQVLNKEDALFGGLGFGYRYIWAGGRYGISAEMSATSSLENIGESYSYKGNVNFQANY
jgi:outer membrane autotransporter protein